MTSPKQLKYRRKNVKIIIWILFEFIWILFALEKLQVFKNCILAPRKCSSCSKYFIQTVKIYFGIFSFFIYFSRILFRSAKLFKKKVPVPDWA